MEGQEPNSHRRAHVLRRLLTDLKEVQENPLPNVCAFPLNDNLLEWHGNLRGTRDCPYEDAVFHIILRFRDDYPIIPPKVILCSPLQHPNVFGHGEDGFICLDMLQEGHWAEEEEVNRVSTNVFCYLITKFFVAIHGLVICLFCAIYLASVGGVFP